MIPDRWTDTHCETEVCLLLEIQNIRLSLRGALKNFEDSFCSLTHKKETEIIIYLKKKKRTNTTWALMYLGKKIVTGLQGILTLAWLLIRRDVWRTWSTQVAHQKSELFCRGDKSADSESLLWWLSASARWPQPCKGGQTATKSGGTGYLSPVIFIQHVEPLESRHQLINVCNNPEN